MSFIRSEIQELPITLNYHPQIDFWNNNCESVLEFIKVHLRKEQK